MVADSDDFDSSPGTKSWVGRSIPRFEDAALLAGRGRYLDDLGVRPGTLQAAILRSQHAHAEIEAIDCAAARAADGVVAVLTGADVKALTTSLVVGVRAAIECWPIAVDRVRYVGEPVAVVVASDRYRAEDALDLIEVGYRQLPAVVDPLAAAAPGAPLLHPAANSNVIGERIFRYGDPESALAAAAHRIRVDIRYPRNSCTPIETYGIVAEYDPSEGGYDVLANFQGPFSLHPVMARALKVPGNRLRLRTPPDSGGSFGVKQAIFPYIVLIAVAARVAGRPVKWIEDRLEHLSASVCATNRVTTLEAAVDDDGRIVALAFDQLEDTGAYLRAPEPATLYRMHGNLTGAYDIRHVKVRNRIVLTNKTPTGLNRGFGGPQAYYPLERLMQRIAIELKLDPLQVIRRNLFPQKPCRTAPRPARYSIPEISQRRLRPQCATAGSTSCTLAAMSRALKAGTTASDLRRWSSQACRTWATSRPRSLPKSAAAPGPRTAPNLPRRSVSTPSAPCRCRWPRPHRAKAIAPCWRKSSPMYSAWSHEMSEWSPKSTRPKTPGP